MTAAADFIVVYVTCADQAQAETIGASAVEGRLAACANIIPGMTSIYRWKGNVETAQEIVLIMKTQAALFDRLAALVRAGHSYEVPCIVALPLTQGEPHYLKWLSQAIEAEVRQE